MTEMPKLSPRQQELVDAMAAAGGVVIPWHDGYWTTPGTPLLHARFGSYDDFPSWHAITGTVYALETRGLIERAHESERGRPLPAWRDPRRLTAAGWAAATEGKT